jgi:hypothetical protein
LFVALALSLATAGEAGATISYVSDSSGVAANTPDDVASPCPAGTRVVGGGAHLNGTNLETEIATSLPYDGGDGDDKPDDGWYAIGNAGPSADTITASAQCSNTGRLKYVASKRKSLDGRRTAKAECPDGYRVVGGGAGIGIASSSTLIRMASSVPRGVGTPSKKDDGWSGTIDNATAGSPKMRTRAICARGVGTSGWSVSNGSPVFANNTQDQLTTNDCNPGHALTSGGGEVIGRPSGAAIATLEQIDTDQWQTWFNNQSGFAQRMSVVSVCAGL